MNTQKHLHIDTDFARDVLRDLYVYRRKRPLVARVLWLTLGWIGGHRFYLERYGTALLMMVTGGGGLMWWVIDGFLLRSMVEAHNREQEQRERAGLPPIELEFMPALTDHVLKQPPPWTRAWFAHSKRARFRRFLGYLAVLLFAGFALGRVAGMNGAEEAITAILVLIGLAAAGDATGGLERFPITRNLLQWGHRLRLFYYFNEPRSPLGLLFRPLTGLLLAPFRRRDQAEVRLYLELGFAFTGLFLMFDLFQYLVAPLLRGGGLAAGIGSTLFNIFVSQAAVTFVITYAFAAPIGAVLTLYMLTQRTHTLPRILSLLTFVMILAGILRRS